MIFVITIPRTSQVGYLWGRLENSLYLTFSKILFMIGLSLLIFPSLLGFNSIINAILNNKFTHIVSKISFMVYLTHLFVILQYSFNKKTESYYSIVPLFNLFIAHATLALIIATYLVFIV